MEHQSKDSQLCHLERRHEFMFEKERKEPWEQHYNAIDDRRLDKQMGLYMLVHHSIALGYT